MAGDKRNPRRGKKEGGRQNCKKCQYISKILPDIWMIKKETNKVKRGRRILIKLWCKMLLSVRVRIEIKHMVRDLKRCR